MPRFKHNFASMEGKLIRGLMVWLMAFGLALLPIAVAVAQHRP